MFVFVALIMFLLDAMKHNSPAFLRKKAAFAGVWSHTSNSEGPDSSNKTFIEFQQGDGSSGPDPRTGRFFSSRPLLFRSSGCNM
jgi:hypothetical protein